MKKDETPKLARRQCQLWQLPRGTRFRGGWVFHGVDGMYAKWSARQVPYAIGGAAWEPVRETEEPGVFEPMPEDDR